MRAPRFGERSLADVLPSVATALGVSGFANALQLEPLTQAAVVVVDGLGYEQLLAAPTHAPIMAGAAADQLPIDAAFPTTTPAGLASLTLGMPPGLHGFVGATFELPDFDMVLNPLHWDSVPSPMAVQPEPNVFSRFDGIRVRSHGPAAFAESGMTRRLLNSAEPMPYEKFDPRSIAIAAGALDYVYLPQLDKVGHTDGPNTAGWNQCLRGIDNIVRDIRGRIPSSAAIIVTSDHGMVAVPDAHRIDIDAPQYAADVRLLAGEPRMRHIYTDAPDSVRERWTQGLGERASVLTRQAAIDAGLFGETDDMLLDRIGDLIAIANDDWAMASRLVDPRVSGLRGLHGALTSAELLVPALVIRGVA